MALLENMVVWDGLDAWLSRMDLSLLQRVGSLDQKIVYDPQFVQKYCTSSVFEILPDKQYRLRDYSLAKVVEDIRKYQAMPTWLRTIRQTWFGTSRLIPNFEMFSFTLVCVQLAAHIHRLSGIEKILSPLNSDFDKVIKATPLNEQYPWWVFTRESQAGNGFLQEGMNKTIKIVAKALRYQLIKREYEQNVTKHEQRNFISRFFFGFFTNIKAQKRWLAQAKKYFEVPLLEVFPMRRMVEISSSHAPLNSDSPDGNSLLPDELMTDFTGMIERAMSEYPNSLDNKDKREVIIRGGARTGQQIKILYSHICKEYQKWMDSKQDDLSSKQRDFLDSQVMHWLSEYGENVVEIFGQMTEINSQYRKLLHSNKEILKNDITHLQQICKDFIKKITQEFGDSPMFKSLIPHLRETAKSWIKNLKQHQLVHTPNSKSTMPTQVTNRWLARLTQKPEARGDFWRETHRYYINLFNQWGEGCGFRLRDIQAIENELKRQKEKIDKLKKLDNLAEMGMSPQQKELHGKYNPWHQHYKRTDDLLKSMAELRKLIDDFCKIFLDYEADISSFTSGEKVDKLVANQQLAMDAEVERIIDERFKHRPDDAAILQKYGWLGKKNLTEFIKNHRHETQKKAVLHIKAMFEQPDEDLFNKVYNQRYQNHTYTVLMEGMQKLKQKAADILEGFPAAASAIPEHQRAFKVRELTDQSAMVIQESKEIISEFLSDMPEELLAVFDQYVKEQQLLLREAMYNYIFTHWEILEIPRAWSDVLEGNDKWDNQATVKVSSDMKQDMRVLKLPYQEGETLSYSVLRKAFRSRVLETRPDKHGASITETRKSADILTANERLQQKLRNTSKSGKACNQQEKERVKREVDFLETIIYMHHQKKECIKVSERIAQRKVENEQIKQMHEEYMARFSEEGAKLLDEQLEKIHEQGDRLEAELRLQFEQLEARLEQRLNDHQERIGETRILSR